VLRGTDSDALCDHCDDYWILYGKIYRRFNEEVSEEEIRKF
jgi:hypothetical protein